jgi:predicted component of type VI protein secretion system
LKEWIKTKRQSRESANVCSYYWKAFECEICKTSYPYVFKANGHKYCLIDSKDLTSSYTNYIILESLNLEKNTSRMVHIISPDALKSAFKIGRGHDSDIRVNDISVSRCHAAIKFSNNSFYLQDEKSKFGTLVLIKSQLHLHTKHTQLSVQVGRSVVNFLVKKSPPN